MGDVGRGQGVFPGPSERHAVLVLRCCGHTSSRALKYFLLRTVYIGAAAFVMVSVITFGFILV